MATPADIFSSPTLTVSSMTSSFDTLSLTHSFSTPPDDNDEIVWDISETSSSASSSDLTESSVSLSLASDDDFIVLSRPRSPSDTVLSLQDPEDYQSTYRSVVAELSTVELNDLLPFSRHRSTQPRSPQTARKAKAPVPKPKKNPRAPTTPVAPKKPKKPKAKRPKATKTVVPTDAQASTQHVSTPSSQSTKKHPTPLPVVSNPYLSTTAKDKPKSKRAKRGKIKIAANAQPSEPVTKTTLGTRPIVDDVSDAGQDSENSDAQAWRYDDAKQYISSFLSNPAHTATNRLTLLQSLIIELGVCDAPPTQTTASSALLPRTLTAAKAFLKSNVFLNIRDYLAVREQGQAALQAVMHPSRNALIKDIKKNGKRASLKWVKKHGLQVLLVTCHY